MEYHVHRLGNDIKRDFCKHFDKVYVEDVRPSNADRVKMKCPECSREYTLSGLYAWVKIDTCPDDAVEGQIENDNAIEC